VFVSLDASSVPPVTELRSEFRQHLRTIDLKVIQLFALVSEDLSVAARALLNGDAGALHVVAEREQTVDGLYRELEALVTSQLVLQAPVAADFRFLLSVLRIVPELERSHDLVVHIAEHATPILDDDLSLRARGLLQQMGDAANHMWAGAAIAWYERDANSVPELQDRDDDLESLHSTLTAELASGSTKLPVAMDMTLVARYYQRLGDHALNIARRVIYLAGGRTSEST
jgi:phosphate transport system protein